MNQIKRQHCLEIFSVNQVSYASILSQVRNDASEKEIHDKLQSIQKFQEKETLMKESYDNEIMIN